MKDGGYHDNLNENCGSEVTMDNVTCKEEEKKDELHISEMEKKRKKDEEGELVNNYFDGSYS